ncbi:MAG: hypothetical protein Q9168_005230 [Polycauliona sp. 1 TL-2023]
MSRLQELPDDFDSSNPLPPSAETPFPISSKAKSNNASSSTTPALPPAMDSVRSYTADEIVNLMNRTPLFMTSLDEVAGVDGKDDEPSIIAPEDNVELEALRALQYEGTRAEIAVGFKERGNEMVREKKWGDAKEFYTKAIMALKKDKMQKGDGNSAGGEASEHEKDRVEEKQIEEACYVNRALCNLQLENYRSTLHDTSHTLLLNPRNTKAHYRSTLALLALQKHDLALDTCNRGLALTSSPTATATKPSAEHTAFLSLHTRILTAKKSADEKETARTTAESNKKKEQVTLNAAISARGISLKWTGKQPDLEDAVIHLSPDPLSPTSELHFPILVLYPIHERSDFLKSVAETAKFGEILDTVIGEGGELEWDMGKEYGKKGVEIFMETRVGGMVKVGRKMGLLDVLAGGKVEVVDGVVRVFVVPKEKVEGWIEGMKRMKGK